MQEYEEVAKELLRCKFRKDQKEALELLDQYYSAKNRPSAIDAEPEEKTRKSLADKPKEV